MCQVEKALAAMANTEPNMDNMETMPLEANTH